VSQSKKSSGLDRVSRRRNAALGTMCLVLYVELSVATRVLLQMITGKSWFITSLVVPFLIVSVLYFKLEEWLWPEPPEAPAEDKIWEPVPPQSTPVDPGR
jgi:hypothetical protein